MNPNFWGGKGQPLSRILFGRIGDENPNHPGVYRFSSSEGFVVNDAHILSPDADTEGGGEATKPRAGSYCVAAMTSDGAQCFIIGFARMATFDEDRDDAPQVGNPEDNNSAGDKVYQTSGGARLILKRGGAVMIEGGAGTGVILNPLNNAMTLRATNFSQIADGYQARRGRKEIGKTKPETIHQETFLHQVGPTYDRIVVQHGELGGDARRQITIEAVTTVRSSETATLRTRETYKSDGSWIGEGPKYQFGGPNANQQGVLGNELVTAISKLIDIIAALKVNTAWGPSTPPLPNTQTDLAQLKAELEDKILSTFLFLAKNPPTLT